MMLKAVAALAAMAALAMPAPAQTVTATDPNTVVQALQAGGYAARLTRDEYGNPQIDSASSGSNFSVFFFDCTDGRDCGAIQFHASYELDPPPADRMAEWNRTKRYARGFISQDNWATAEMDVLIEPGGISRELFLDNLELWTTLMSQFEEHIGWE